MLDAYAIYSQWWLDHYGYPFPASREDWDRWCAKPRPFKTYVPDFDISEEQRDGWGYHNRT